MRHFLLPALCAALMSTGAFAQEPSQTVSVATAKPLHLLSETAVPSKDAPAALYLMTKGEFETTAAFEQRLAKAYDPNKIYYFVVAAADLSTAYAQYTYNADTNTLTASAGSRYTAQSDAPFDSQDGAPVLIWGEANHEDAPTGSTPKSTISAETSNVVGYVLNFRNVTALPTSYFDRSAGKFVVRATAKPDDAKALSRQMFLLVGVTFPDSKRIQRQRLTDTAPAKADLPATQRYIVTADAVVKHLILCCKNDKPVLAEYVVPAQTADPASQTLPLLPAQPSQVSAQIVARGDFDIPDELRRVKISGASVRVRVTIEADGSHSEQLLEGSGNADMDRAVLAWMHSWRWDPAKEDGKPVASTVVRKVSLDQN